VRGAAQQIKGKVETAVGKVKDAARDAKDNAAAQHKCNQKAGAGAARLSSRKIAT